MTGLRKNNGSSLCSLSTGVEPTEKTHLSIRGVWQARLELGVEGTVQSHWRSFLCPTTMESGPKNALHPSAACLPSVPAWVNSPAQCSFEMQASLQKGWEEDTASKTGSHLYHTLPMCRDRYNNGSPKEACAANFPHTKEGTTFLATSIKAHLTFFHFCFCKPELLSCPGWLQGWTWLWQQGTMKK